LKWPHDQQRFQSKSGRESVVHSDFVFPSLALLAVTQHQKRYVNGLNKNRLAGHRRLMPVNPSYSGGRDLEDHGSKPAPWGK
jgi:hypothetical protein